MKKEKTIELYHVTCGLYAQKSLFSPFANNTGDFLVSKEKAYEIYNGINGDSFDKKEILLQRAKGHTTYNKTMIVVKMPISIYEDFCLTFDGEPVSEEEQQEHINNMAWDESCEFGDAIEDELFEIEPFKDGFIKPYIKNVRKWTEEEIAVS
jgi:hypothetical protein